MYPTANKFYHNEPNQQQHYEIEQTKMSKLLLIQNLQDNFSNQYHVNIPYNFITRELDLTTILHEIFFQILNPIYQYQIFYFSNLSGYFHFGGTYPWEEKFILGEEFIPKEEIFVAFRRIVMVDGSSGCKMSNKASNYAGNQQHTNENKKKRRINDRTILQTLQKVSLWRSKCQQQKITYQQAAKQIDIPKKTLDDYFALIRLGQQYSFDFQKNLNQKIGILRQFVKQKNKLNKQKKKKCVSNSSQFNSNQSGVIKSTKNKYLSQFKYQNIKNSHQNDDNNYIQERKISIIDKMMFQDDSDNEEAEQ